MDMQEDEVEARVLAYFSSFNTIIELHGLQTVLGRTPRQDARRSLQGEVPHEDTAGEPLAGHAEEGRHSNCDTRASVCKNR